MTDYNDGSWWGWNGGECPVHPETVVDVVMKNPQGYDEDTWRRLNERAGDLGRGWSHHRGCSEIIAFRVVRAYREPREFWVAQGGGGYVQVAAGGHPSAFKVREVLE